MRRHLAIAASCWLVGDAMIVILLMINGLSFWGTPIELALIGFLLGLLALGYLRCH